MSEDSPSEDTYFRSIVDELLEKQLQAKILVVEHFMKNPGVIATFDDYTFEFSDMEFHVDHESLRDLNEYKVTIVENIRVRRLTEEEKNELRSSLGRDSRGEDRPSGGDSAA